LDLLSSTFRSEGQQWTHLLADAEHFAASAHGYDGYLISGSMRSVVDDAATPSVANVLALIRDVHANSNAPILGICFGSQAIAAALGGRVSQNPSGRFRLGVDELRWSEAADPLRWPETLRGATLAQSHGECVTELPSHSELLASSATTPHEVFLVHDRFLGVQGHPEADSKTFRESFMPLHRSLFDLNQWQAVEDESKQPLMREAVISLGRRLLADGRL